VEEPVRFVLRLKDVESLASLCSEFGISRVTGYRLYYPGNASTLSDLRFSGVL
jgi:hypothetical protein